MHKGRIIVERSLSDLQGNVSKIQVAFQEGMPTLPPDFEKMEYIEFLNERRLRMAQIVQKAYKKLCE